MSYEDHLAAAWERHVAVCEWHEDQPKYDCVPCERAASLFVPDTNKEAQGWA